MKIEKVYRKDLNAWRWKIDITIGKKRIRRADFLTKREAIEAIAAKHSEARAVRYGLIKPRPKVSLQNLFDRVSQSPEMKARPQTLAIFENFLDLIDPDLQLVDLSRTDWRTFVEDCKDRVLKAATINRYLAAISGMLRSAPEYFPALKDWSPPKAPWESEPLGRDRILSVQEIKALLGGFRAERQKRERERGVRWRHEVLDLFRLMLLTAAREGELLHLRQSAISWDWKTVQIDSKKGGGSRRVIPLSDSALEILKDRRANAQRVFNQIPKNALYNALDRVGQIAEVPYGEKIDNGWVIYDLRHVAATVMENAGIPYSAVSGILGHKRKDQTATYTHAQLSTMRRGVESLESWCREIDGFILESDKIQLHTTALRQSARG